MGQRKKSAGIIVIGDEILSGRTQDLNSPFLIEKLAQKGVEVRFCFTIPDETKTIAHFASTYSEQVTWVFTSGGIGPTPDDVTLLALAQAFGLPLVPNPLLKALIQSYYKDKCTPEHLKMALVPEGTSLLHGHQNKLHALQFRNFFVLPGVPGFFKKVFMGIEDYFFDEIIPKKEIGLIADEGSIVKSLEETLARYPGVKIGSYPSYHEDGNRIQLVMEHHDGVILDQAYEFLLPKLKTFLTK